MTEAFCKASAGFLFGEMGDENIAFPLTHKNAGIFVKRNSRRKSKPLSISKGGLNRERCDEFAVAKDKKKMSEKRLHLRPREHSDRHPIQSKMLNHPSRCSFFSNNIQNQ